MGGLFHIKYYKNTEICHITSCAYPLLGTKLFRLKFPRSCLGWWVIALFYHIPSMTSTPSAVLTRVLPPPRSPLRHGDVRAIAKWKILCYQDSCSAVPCSALERPQWGLSGTGPRRSRGHDIGTVRVWLWHKRGDDGA